ncbi:MAG: Gfo/Idh/MocA family protein [Pyrinomonadaceae bacterium]
MIRLAIIGLGGVTGNIHLPAYSQLKDRVSLVAGCDVKSESRSLAKSKWQVPQVFDNPQEMIEKTRPDMVAICTPPAMHHEHTLLALDHGCHVFCEKPVAESLSQVDEMISASQQAQRFVVVNNQFPYMNIHLAAKRQIGSPEFGRLLYLHAWQIFHQTAITEAAWRGELKRRLCFEFGIHVFELIRFFFAATPTKVFAHMPSPRPDAQSDIINIISVEFADGRAASIVLNRLSKAPERYLDMRLDGEFASIHTSIGGEVRFEVGLHTRAKRPFAGLNFVKGGKAVLHTSEKSKIIAKDGINPFASATARHFGNFIKAIQTGETPACTIQDNRNTLALVLAAYDSAQLGRAIETDDYLQTIDSPMRALVMEELSSQEKTSAS